MSSQSQPSADAKSARPKAPPSAAWTPGPWLAAARPSSIVGWPVVAPANGRSICGVTYFGLGEGFENHDRESAANAKLIAAAPDLYEALDYIGNNDDWWGCQRFAEDSDGDFLLRVLNAIRTRARAALAKAGGQ